MRTIEIRSKRGRAFSSLRAVAFGSVDYQRRHLPAQRQPGVKIAAVMDAGPEPGIGGFRLKVSDEFRVAWEQVGQYLTLAAGKRGVRRRVARMIGVREQRCDSRIELIRADRPICVVGVPARDQ